MGIQQVAEDGCIGGPVSVPLGFLIGHKPLKGENRDMAEPSEEAQAELETAVEAGQEEQEEQAAPDPVQERLERLEGYLGQLTNANQALHDNLGYLSRQLERLNNQPKTAESDTRIDKLSQQVEKLLLRGMDQEEQSGYFQEQLESSRRARQELPVAQKPAENTPDPESISLREGYKTVMSEIAEFCEDFGYPFALLWSKVDPMVSRNELRRGEATANDPRGWRPFVKEVKELARREKELLVNQAKPRVAISTAKSGGSQGGSEQELVNRYGKGEALTQEERLRAAAAVKKGVVPVQS